MELLERDDYLSELNHHLLNVSAGIGHSVFVMGEAGIGKSSLLSKFLSEVGHSAIVLVGSCDSLFTPRPLGPLFDIAGQLDEDFSNLVRTEKDRAIIFSSFLSRLSALSRPVILVFEDIHWADDATLDLIKFVARRINKLRCLFIVSLRDDETSGKISTSSMLGELPAGHFTKLNLKRFSRDLVQLLAKRNHRLSGEQLFHLTSGNPFYVMELLSQGERLEIPEKIKDSILSRFHSRSEQTKSLWEFLSVLASPKVNAALLSYIETTFGNCIDECIAAGIIVSRPGHLSFNHELFRITIEESLAASKRKHLHKTILNILRASGKANLSQLVHHAKYAEEYDLVLELAPQAAREACGVGAHREAAKLFAIAIEVAEPGSFVQAELYDRHAYECYLIYHLSEAIASQNKALEIWRSKNMQLREGDALRFLSRLWWFAGDRQQAVEFASMAVSVLDSLDNSLRERAWAYSNFAQLEMLNENTHSALKWGNKAIDIAREINDNEVLSHALNNVGSTFLRTIDKQELGEQYIRESLAIALKSKFQEHAARAYVNLGYTFYLIKQYDKAKQALELGIRYCEERDLDFLRYYMMGCLASVHVETGEWDKGRESAERLTELSQHVLVKIVATVALAKVAMRRGEFGTADTLINEIKKPAWDTTELQRIIPVVCLELELKWLKADPVAADEFERIEKNVDFKQNLWFYSDYCYWKHRYGYLTNDDERVITPLRLELNGDYTKAAEEWKKIGCVYESALAWLSNGPATHQEGILCLEGLAATATVESLTNRYMIKSPRTKNHRESTLNNPAQLTDRQIDILRLLKHGLQNKEIAEKLFISSKTVDHHISAILSKLAVKSRSKAVVEAQRLGILD